MSPCTTLLVCVFWVAKTPECYCDLVLLYFRCCMMDFVQYVWPRSSSCSTFNAKSQKRWILSTSPCQAMMAGTTRKSAMRWPWRKCMSLTRRTRSAWVHHFYQSCWNQTYWSQTASNIKLCVFAWRPLTGFFRARFTGASQHSQWCTVPWVWAGWLDWWRGHLWGHSWTSPTLSLPGIGWSGLDVGTSARRAAVRLNPRKNEVHLLRLLTGWNQKKRLLVSTELYTMDFLENVVLHDKICLPKCK